MNFNASQINPAVIETKIQHLLLNRSHTYFKEQLMKYKQFELITNFQHLFFVHSREGDNKYETLPFVDACISNAWRGIPRAKSIAENLSYEWSPSLNRQGVCLRVCRYHCGLWVSDDVCGCGSEWPWATDLFTHPRYQDSVSRKRKAAI